MTARVLVVGGTGAFGSRLVASLVATTDATVVIAGRNLDACERLAADLRSDHPGRLIETKRFDRSRATAGDLRALGPAVVVDAAGPFQGGDLSFAKAVIEAGVHYVDLADARDFVARFPTLDAAARAACVVAIAGASSTPAISHAALDALTDGWQEVETVEVAISPGNRAPRGLSVMQAILSYAGQPVRLLRERRLGEAPGWGLTVRRRMPGLGRRLLSLCETPDLDLVPARRPDVKTAIFRAGLELPALHLGLWLLSLAPRAGLPVDLARLARPLRRIAMAFERFGTDRGGMTVDVSGVDGRGRRARAVWSLVAEAGDGPNVPTLPALAFVRALLAGTPPAPPGAHVAAGLLDLDVLTRETALFAMRTSIDRASPDASSVFERTLGTDVERMPAVVRAAHDPKPVVELSGTVDVDGADSGLGRLVARAMGFPKPARGAPAVVEIKAVAGGEVWTRRFGGRSFSSRITVGGEPGMLVETFGPFAFDLALTATHDGFSMSVEGWRAFGLPLPRRLSPTTAARGFARGDGGYGFDVSIAMPSIGRLVRYRGEMEGPAATEDQRQ